MQKAHFHIKRWKIMFMCNRAKYQVIRARDKDFIKWATAVYGTKNLFQMLGRLKNIS